MGWYFSYGASRADVIKELTGTVNAGEAKRATLAKFASGNTLWTVEEVTRDAATPPHRFIGCYLLQRSSDGWGYKPMEEAMGPCQKSCPPKFLDMVPCPGGYATAWRVGVLAYWAERARRRAEKTTRKRMFVMGGVS